MAKKKDDGYEGALSSIYDFIFNYNKSPSRPPRPVRPSGVSGSDEMARVMAELAMQPFTYIPDGAFAPFNEATGEKFIAIELEPGGEAVELKLGNLVSALKDPNKFVDKVFEDQKEENKWKRYQTTASIFDQAIAAGLAKKAGMDMGDAWSFGTAARGEYKEDLGATGSFGMREKHREITAKNAALSSAMQQAKEQAIAEGLDRTTDAYADRVYELSRGFKAQAKDDATTLQKAMSSNSRLRKFGFTGGGSVNPQVEADLRAELARSIPDPAKVDRLVDSLKVEVDSNKMYKGGITAYRMAYSKNQNMLAQLADNADEANKHLTASNYALMWERLHGGDENINAFFNSKMINKEFEQTIANAEARIAAIGNPADPESIALTNYINELNTSRSNAYKLEKAAGDRMNKSGDYWRTGSMVTGNRQPTADVKDKIEGSKELIKAEKAKLQMQIALTDDRFEKRELMAQIFRLERGMDRVGASVGPNIRGRVASWSNAYRALQGTRGGLAGGLITGAAWWKKFEGAPGAPGGSKIQRRVTKGDGTTGYAKGYINDEDKAADWGIDVEKEKDAYIILPRDDYHIAYQKFAGAYYLTPGSIGKTLFWNGEGFSYVAEMKQRGIQRGFFQDRGDHLSDFVTANSGLFTGSSFQDLLNPDGSVNKEVLANNYLEVMDILAANEGLLSPQLADILKQANKKYSSMNRYFKIGSFYNNKVAGNISRVTGVGNKVGWVMNKTGLGAAIARMPGGAGLTQVLTGKLALKSWIRGGVHGVAVAIGVGTGFVGTVVVEAIAWVGTEIGMKLAKAGMKISIVAFLGICGLCGLALMMFTGAGISSTQSEVGYTSMVPGEHLACAGSAGPYPQDGSSPYQPIQLPPGMIKEYPPTGTVPPGTIVMPAATGEVPEDAECPVDIYSCNQGPFGRYSHNVPDFPKTLAIDIGGGPFKAPSDGYVIQSNAHAYCGEGGPDRGGELKFVDLEGNIYTLLHVDPSVVASNTLITKGTQLATMSTNIPTSPCWTGAHYHLEIEQGEGNYVNAEQWYRDLGCSFGTCPN